MPTLADLAEAIAGSVLPDGARRALGGQTLGPVATDSRQVQPGEVFWAISGPHHDGNDFLAEAYRRGACGAITSRPCDVPSGRWAIRVNDTQTALEHWAARLRQQFSGTVVAVTGSVGKTTARQMIHTVLQSRLAGCVSPKNYNNQLGVPLSMLQINSQHDYALFELGASQPGEIADLAHLCRPHLGVITHIAAAHLEGFGSRLGIARAKAELLAALPADGLAVLGDDPWLRRVARYCPARVCWVGAHKSCDLVARDVRTSPGRLEFRVEGCHFSIPVWGRHHLISALAALAVGRELGIDVATCAEALAHFEPAPMRCQVIEARGATLIHDAYNANPASMRAALELLAEMAPKGRRIAVLGDMAELGAESLALHRQLGRNAVRVGRADVLIACGQYAQQVVDAARAAGLSEACSIHVEGVPLATASLAPMIAPGDVMLVKGSRSMALEHLVAALVNEPADAIPPVSPPEISSQAIGKLHRSRRVCGNLTLPCSLLGRSNQLVASRLLGQPRRQVLRGEALD